MDEKVLKMEKGRGMSHRDKMLTSFSIWFGTFSLGVSSGLIGPSLIEFSRKFGTDDVSTVSKVFSVHTLAVIVGAIVCGSVFNHVNRQLASAILISVMGLSVILLPNLPSLMLFFVVSFIQVFCWAGYDTSQIVWMIELWAGDAAAFIQTQHFAFAAGALVSPLIVKPFLPDTEYVHSTGGNVTIVDEQVTPVKSFLYVPFLIGGLIMIASGALIFVLYKSKPYERPDCPVSKDSNPKSSRRTLLLVLSALFVGFYCGMEASSFHFLSAFAQFTDLHLSQRQAAGVVCYFTGAFTFGRAVGIGVVLRIRSEVLLSTNLLIVITGNCFLNLSNTCSWALHAAAATLGLGYSTVFAGYFGFIEKYMNVGNMEGAVIIAVGSSIYSVYPLVIGQLIEHSPFVVLYANIFSLSVTVPLFLVIWTVVKNPVRTTRFELESKAYDECWIPILNKEESD